MSSLIWTEEEYGTGVPEIDEQHQELFDRVNKLLSACRTGSGKEEVTDVMNFLAEYVVEHFQCEEAIMEERDCSACGTNKLAHTKFIVAFTKLKRGFEQDGPSAAFVRGLQELVVDWLNSHIKKVDTKLQETAAQAA